MTKLRWFAYIGFVTVVSLLLCEIALRVLYQEPWHQQLLRVQRFERTTSQRNDLGLRDRNYSADKPGTVRRVLFLGDSFTQGSGVMDDAAVFPEIIEAGLSADTVIHGVDSIEVLNGGIRGSNPSVWLDLLTRVEDSFQPDVIVVVFFLRDGVRSTSIHHFFGPIRDKIARRNDASQLYGYSYIYRVLRDAADRELVGHDYTRHLHAGYFARNRARRAHWKTQQQHLREIFTIARARSAAVGLVVFPVLAGLKDDPYPFERIVRMLRRFGRINDVSVHDLLEDFRGLYGPDLWISGFNQHPNERAHAIAAEALYPFVLRLLREAEGPDPR